MKKEQHKTQMTMVGGSSLLVIFAVLCLVVFALLGISTVQANKRLEDISIRAVEDYYAADSRGEAILAQLRRGSIPEGVSLEDGIFCYRCTVSDTQALEIRVRAEDWTVLRWQLVSTVEWKEEDNLSVWDGTS